jgi:hypothetical protein
MLRWLHEQRRGFTTSLQLRLCQIWNYSQDNHHDQTCTELSQRIRGVKTQPQRHDVTSGSACNAGIAAHGSVGAMEPHVLQRSQALAKEYEQKQAHEVEMETLICLRKPRFKSPLSYNSLLFIAIVRMPLVRQNILKPGARTLLPWL